MKGNPYLQLRVISRSVINFNTVYLSEEASLGVLSADGNFCIGIVTGYTMSVKESEI